MSQAIPLVMFLLLSFIASAVSITLKPEPTHTLQTIDGWGTSLCWWANVIGKYPEPSRTQLLDLVFDVNKGIGLNIVRYNIGGSNPKNPDKSLRPGAMIPSFLSENGTYDWSVDEGQRYILLEARKRGVKFFEAFSNSPPYFMTISGSPTGSVNGTDNLKPEYYDAFADYLAEVVKHYLEKYGIIFQSVEPLNEPISTWWKYGISQEGCHFDRSTQNIILIKLNNALIKKDLKKYGISVSGSDENSIDDAVITMKNYSEQCLSSITKVNTHSYNGDQRRMLSELAKSQGKKLWMSEFGTGSFGYKDIRSALKLSNQILLDVKQMLSTAWVYWQAIETADIKNQWGFIQAPYITPGPYQIGKQFYGMGQYSKFIKQNYKIVSDERNDTLISISNDGMELVIVWTNDSNKTLIAELNLSSFIKSSGAVIKMWRTSDTENLTPLSDIIIPASKTSVQVSLVPLSITTFIITSNGLQFM